MSKVVQRGAAAAMRVRSMSSAAKSEVTITEEMGRKINPAQTTFGPKDPKVEKWQKHFQDPLNATKPMYRRKGASDDVIVVSTAVAIGTIFVYNVVDFFKW